MSNNIFGEEKQMENGISKKKAAAISAAISAKLASLDGEKKYRIISTQKIKQNWKR